MRGVGVRRVRARGPRAHRFRGHGSPRHGGGLHAPADRDLERAGDTTRRAPRRGAGREVSSLGIEPIRKMLAHAADTGHSN